MTLSQQEVDIKAFINKPAFCFNVESTFPTQFDCSYLSSSLSIFSFIHFYFTSTSLLFPLYFSFWSGSFCFSLIFSRSTRRLNLWASFYGCFGLLPIHWKSHRCSKAYKRYAVVQFGLKSNQDRGHMASPNCHKL